MSIFVLIVESTVIVRCVLYICFLAHRLAVVSSWTHCMIVQDSIELPLSSGAISVHRCQRVLYYNDRAKVSISFPQSRQ